MTSKPAHDRHRVTVMHWRLRYAHLPGNADHVGLQSPQILTRVVSGLNGGSSSVEFAHGRRDPGNGAVFGRSEPALANEGMAGRLTIVGAT